MSQEALVKNASSEKQVKKAEKREKFLEEQRKSDLVAVLGTKEGRRFAWDILSDCGIYEDILEGNSTAHRKLGKRSVGLRLMGLMNAYVPGLLLEMMNENYKKGEK